MKIETKRGDLYIDGKFFAKEQKTIRWDEISAFTYWEERLRGVVEDSGKVTVKFSYRFPIPAPGEWIGKTYIEFDVKQEFDDFTEAIIYWTDDENVPKGTVVFSVKNGRTTIKEKSIKVTEGDFELAIPRVSHSLFGMVHDGEYSFTLQDHFYDSGYSCHSPSWEKLSKKYQEVRLGILCHFDHPDYGELNYERFICLEKVGKFSFCIFDTQEYSSSDPFGRYRLVVIPNKLLKDKND